MRHWVGQIHRTEGRMLPGTKRKKQMGSYCLMPADVSLWDEENVGMVTGNSYITI